MASEGPETILVKKITKALEARGCIVVKVHGSAYMPRGFPDLIIVLPGGATCYVEVKVPGRTDGPAGNGLAALQLSWLWKLAIQGCAVGVADCVEDALLVCGLHA